ncbi:hypothetical protein BO70DRAFT_399623 [Aspergillus heteromorphus CBS 117.55]|uniref:YCII-related domain-containing protein n=1 Tax=Aspergillus heteromorphus CBS 117.55 TaxID=1448321 RepID=A0A317VGN9_9EURO|nr:uncharacterized protein BO70DRAFT_399623 [Aspergillus heteromorphus CBS 117.55]PWY71010.1 hypothetical protein BO70DRAFT_399623 [Aspergillus heteromorphus CBS 117.55]
MSLFLASARATPSRLLQTTFTAQRSFSTPKSSKPWPRKEWLCMIREKPNTAKLRQRYLGPHLRRMRRLSEENKIVSDGNMCLAHPEYKGEKVPTTGSLITFVADSEADVRSLIQQDVLAEKGVWDVENAVVVPYVVSFRSPIDYTANEVLANAFSLMGALQPSAASTKNKRKFVLSSSENINKSEDGSINAEPDASVAESKGTPATETASGSDKAAPEDGKPVAQDAETASGSDKTAPEDGKPVAQDAETASGSDKAALEDGKSVAQDEKEADHK